VPQRKVLDDGPIFKYFAALRLEASSWAKVPQDAKTSEDRRGEVPKSDSGLHLSRQLILPPFSTGFGIAPREEFSIFLPLTRLAHKINESENGNGA
jgi:hypothetical protein